jgi:hypothetical protein
MAKKKQAKTEQPISVEQSDNNNTDTQIDFADNGRQDIETEQPFAGGSVSWVASEYVGHEKSNSWFIKLGAGGLVLAAIVYLVTRDFVSTVVVAIMTAIFGSFAARKPQRIEYSVDNSGLQVGPKNYPYNDFKSFSVLEEVGHSSIVLMPLKRFMPSITIYFDAKDQDQIVSILSGHLPLENRQHDLTDRLMHKIRF